MNILEDLRKYKALRDEVSENFRWLSGTESMAELKEKIDEINHAQIVSLTRGRRWAECHYQESAVTKSAKADRLHEGLPFFVLGSN